MLFAEYEENEVKWNTNDYFVDFDSEKDSSKAWEFVDKITSIKTHVVTKNIGGNTFNQSKSLFNITIFLHRNSKTTVIYVIIPTIMIAIFNIISALLPIEEGSSKIYYLVNEMLCS